MHRSAQDHFDLLEATLAEYAVMMLDPDRIVHHWSSGAEALFGFRESEIVGKSADIIFTPEDRQAGVPEREAAIALRDGRAPDNRWHLCKDGRRVWVNGVMVAFRDDSGPHIGFGKIARDETAAKEARDELEARTKRLARAHSQKDTFLAMLVHEMRNPLIAIRYLVAHLRRGGGGADPAHHYDQIDQQVNDLMRLVDDLLDISRIAAGKVELYKQRVDAAAAMDRAVLAMRGLIDSHRHQLKVVHPPEPLILQADPTRLQQVFVNLLSNAAKYTEEGGRIDFTAERRGSEACFTVRDSGIGISRDMLPRIFEIFAQIDYSFQRSQGGLGIGLTLAKNLVELHGGRIEAHSEGLGKGSQFVVHLPAQERHRLS